MKTITPVRKEHVTNLNTTLRAILAKVPDIISIAYEFDLNDQVHPSVVVTVSRNRRAVEVVMASLGFGELQPHIRVMSGIGRDADSEVRLADGAETGTGMPKVQE